MGIVRLLPPEVANQIAAGEVIERPASVVKELVENALDAGAARIAIRIEGGGADLIEVADDGCGMEAEDARLALERHATSKVRDASDLQAVRSFGFRGEALPSIASVSRLTLTTSAGGDEGTEVRIEAGRLAGDGPAAHPRGTTVRVEGLFHNAPARRKFLRSPGTEASHAIDHLIRLAAAHPAVAFRLTSGGRETFLWPAAAGLRERAAQILGSSEAAALLEVDRSEGRPRVRGLVSAPSLTRASTRDARLFVNDRPVRDRRLLHALTEGAATVVPRGRSPVAFLFLEVPVEEVDVNVHPAKSEVRFARPGAMHDLLLRAVREALTTSRPFAALGARGLDGAVTGEAGELLELGTAAPSAGMPGVAERAAGFSVLTATVGAGAAPGQGPLQGDAPAALPPGAVPAAAIPLDRLTPLAQFRDTYILASAPDGLVIVDQHAAHERVLYERLLADAEARRLERQRLLFPLLLEVSPAERQALEEARELFEDLGFTLAGFGPGTLRVEEIPGMLKATAAEGLLRELLGDLLERTQGRAAGDLRHRIAATSACHAAVRAHEALPGPALDRLVRDLLEARSPMTCPHGRPTILRLPIERLEREFRRR
ncbi:MAG TPA: DNA mismatch repair endonuclease MutL [Verrucomicrobiae bacterium]|nr:DNA mismatch repair endonuclease MutL [Verrucomicrobiae bacterium]